MPDLLLFAQEAHDAERLRVLRPAGSPLPVRLPRRGTARRILRPPENQGGDVPVPSWLRCADSAAIFASIVSVTSINMSGAVVELT